MLNNRCRRAPRTFRNNAATQLHIDGPSDPLTARRNLAGCLTLHGSRDISLNIERRKDEEHAAFPIRIEFSQRLPSSSVRRADVDGNQIKPALSSKATDYRCNPSYQFNPPSLGSPNPRIGAIGYFEQVYPFQSPVASTNS